MRGRGKNTTIQSAWNICAALVFFTSLTLRAQSDTFSNLLVQGENLSKTGDVTKALQTYEQAELLESNSAPELCALTHHFCDLIYDTSSDETQKILAEHALATAKLAVQADSQNALAHICLAIGYAKNFPYVDTRTKVGYSRHIKLEADAAVALDPKQDLAYYLLGRWNHGVAGMNALEKGFVKIIYGGLPRASNEAAVENLKKAIGLSPNRIITHAELAKVYQAIGQKEFAVQELKQCTALTPLDRDDRDAQQEAAKELREKSL